MLVFFGNVYFHTYPFEIYLSVFLYLFLGFVFIFLEAGILKRVSQTKGSALYFSEAKPYLRHEGSIIYLVWLFFGVSLASFLYMLHMDGGLSQYVYSMKLRNVTWAGSAAITVFMKLTTVIPLFFFSLGFVFSIKNKKRWYVNLLFATITCSILALFTGSRSSVLYIFLYIFLSFHYLVRKVSLRLAFVICIALLFFAAVLGGLRELASFNSQGDFTIEQRSGFLHTPFETGLRGLDILYAKNYYNLEYGLTYVSAVTNFIPRELWSNKPLSGGVILTSFAQGDSYTGTTNYSTGAVAEGVINFGYFFGYFAGSFWVIVAFLIALHYYGRLLESIRFEINPWRKHRYLYFYIVVFGLPGAFLVGEFSATIAMVVKSLLFYFLMMYVIRLVAKR